jgi:hypothetical protein
VEHIQRICDYRTPYGVYGLLQPGLAGCSVGRFAMWLGRCDDGIRDGMLCLVGGWLGLVTTYAWLTLTPLGILRRCMTFFGVVSGLD